MIKSPCFNCPNRNMSCHSKCEPYADYRAKIDGLNNKKPKPKTKPVWSMIV